MNWLLRFLKGLVPTQEAKDAAIWTAMWVEGYSDFEIEQEIAARKLSD